MCWLQTAQNLPLKKLIKMFKKKKKTPTQSRSPYTGAQDPHGRGCCQANHSLHCAFVLTFLVPLLIFPILQIKKQKHVLHKNLHINVQASDNV